MSGWAHGDLLEIRACSRCLQVSHEADKGIHPFLSSI